MRCGAYDCYSLDLGSFRVDGGALFGMIPKTEWDQQISADTHNLVTIKTRSLLIMGNGKNILVDVGFGTKLSDQLKQSYQVSPSMDINLLLSGYELDREKITDVVLTHLHLDHAGGATTLFGRSVAPTFPNATYYIQSEQWETALDPHERERESFIIDDFVPLNSAGQLQLLDGGLKLTDGIEIMVTYTHTKAQQHVLVEDDSRPLFFASDLVPTQAHIPVPWHMAYDNDPLRLYPEKDFFLRKAVRDNWVIAFPHDPSLEAATLKEGPKWIEFEEAVSL